MRESGICFKSNGLHDSAPSAIAFASVMSCSRSFRTCVTSKNMRAATFGMWIDGFHLIEKSAPCISFKMESALYK